MAVDVSGLRALLEAGKWQPGDRLVRIWPSDELTNTSAAARIIAESATTAFRLALTPSKDTQDHD